MRRVKSLVKQHQIHDDGFCLCCFRSLGKSHTMACEFRTRKAQVSLMYEVEIPVSWGQREVGANVREIVDYLDELTTFRFRKPLSVQLES